jgi:hypothetical protein
MTRPMTRTVLLNNVDHRDLRLAPRHGAGFGDSVNQMLVFPTEFEELQREYPIFFLKGADGGFQAVALLGLDRDENLFLEGEAWQARYVPAVQARGPFSIALQEREAGPEPMIHVDLDDPRIGTDDGIPLFLPQGGQSPLLDHVGAVLRSIYVGLEISGPMFAAFAELELIEPVTVEILLSDVDRYDLPDYHAVSEERLAALGGADLERLNRAGFLRAAFLAAASLANVRRLIDLKNRKTGAGAHG